MPIQALDDSNKWRHTWCEGVWLTPNDEFIELAIFVDYTVTESYWMDGRVVITRGRTFDPAGGKFPITVQASTKGEAVVLESIEVWELGSAWVNESTALKMIP